MARPRNRFESEVHLGFLVIVCLLLALNFLSNEFIFKSYSKLAEEVGRDLLQTAHVIQAELSRDTNSSLSAAISEDSIAAAHNLTGFAILPAMPETTTPDARRQWFSDVSENLPLSEVEGVAVKPLLSDYYELTRGQNQEYFLVYPTSTPDQQLFVLTTESPHLARLDSFRSTLSWLLPLVVGFSLVLYLLWSQLIFKPFRKIKQQAELAGRLLVDAENDADAIVEEYRRIIEQLRRKEVELTRLNASIRSRADRLEQLNQYLLRSSRAGIITIDIDGTILSVNDAAGLLLDLMPENSAGGRYDELLEQYPELRSMVSGAIDSWRYESYREVSLPSADTNKTVGVAVSPIQDDKMVTVGVSIFLNDLTEMTRLRRELEQKNRLASLGEMAGGLAHQLRNSLGAMTGYGRLVKKRLSKASLPVENIESMLREADEAEALIGRFLSFARPFDYTPHLIGLKSFLEDVIAGFAVRDDSRGLSFHLDCTAGLEIQADAALLKQAVGNLIDNALHAYDVDGGEVSVSARDTRHEIIITVADCAGGIEQDKLDRIFTPFFSTRAAGSGLGLPLADKIVDLHGGRIEVASEEGRGTVFSIHLPRNTVFDPSPVRA